jgi:putative membrane protein
MMLGTGWGTGVGGWLWMIGGLVVVVGLVVLVIWALGATARAGQFDGGRSADQRTPLDILRERFARGEISEAEFEQAKRILGY